MPAAIVLNLSESGWKPHQGNLLKRHLKVKKSSWLKGTVSRDFRLLVFSRIRFPQAPEYPIRAVSNLRDFAKRFETVLMGYSGAGGGLIHEQNQKQKISWHCPFNLPRTNSPWPTEAVQWQGLWHLLDEQHREARIKTLALPNHKYHLSFSMDTFVKQHGTNHFISTCYKAKLQ